MNKHLIYLCLSIIFLSTMVLVKLWIIPYMLLHLFPQSDLVSKINEVSIMVVGGLTFLLFMILGYIGKHIFSMSLKGHLGLHFVIQIPFIIHAFLQQALQKDNSMGLLHVFAEGWCGLIAEPTRLLFMVYPWTDAAAILSSFFFLGLGRSIEIVDEDMKWKDRNHKIKARQV
jgi:hypothetical protein